MTMKNLHDLKMEKKKQDANKVGSVDGYTLRISSD